MSALTFIISSAFSLYIWALLMRVWMQLVRSDYYNPFAQAVVRITQPIIKPLRRIIPPIGPVDTASLALAYVLSVIKLPVLIAISIGTVPVDILQFLLIGLASLLKSMGNLLFWVLIIRAIMSWISQGRGAMDYLLYQLTEPLMAPIRRIIPTFGGLDFSVMILLFALTALNYLGRDFFGILWATI